MLVLVEGTLQQPLPEKVRRAASAWLGPMADQGALHGGWVDPKGGRVWMVVSAEDLAAAEEVVGDLPVARDGLISFAFTPVEAMRTF
jgi:hypothetical protein